ncbi:type I DNA topoisomerase, partial [Candidatus Woesebacteria bacterium]|nr:type I DNA topoisomerase [Candidatus Woesebacteria bacterium]
SIDIEHDFAPNYQVLSSKKANVANLKRLAKDAKTVYLATDPDREGEAIAFHVQYLLQDGRKQDKSDQSRFRRVTFHEITKSAIEEALKHPGVVNMPMVNAQQARRVLDRLVGYTLSPVLWKKVRRGLSAGRVQSVAVRLIVDKEREIRAFVPEEYWEIWTILKSQMANSQMGELRVQLTKIGGKPAKIGDGELAKKVIADLENAKYTVSDVTKEEQHSSPFPPFTTSLLQRAGSNVFSWSAKMTMQIAQSLYEHGYITYHRTDSFNLAKEATDMARDYIESTYGKEYLPSKVRTYKTKDASAQEAHEAIRPTDVARKGEDLTASGMTSRHQKLYDLIRTRFLQCQMEDAKFDKTSILVNADAKYILKADGKRMIFDGYLKLGKSADDVFLPELASGEVLSLIKVDPTQKFTNPPARYSEAGLIKELEKRGIGRPSTFAAIITTIQDRGYVVKEVKSFVPTAIGEAVVDFLVTNFGNVFAYEFTAKMESNLDLIAEGKKQWVPTVREFWDPLSEQVKKVEETGERVKVKVETTGAKCPDCPEGEVVIRTGKYGKFLSCSTYPECKYTKPYIEYVEGVVCPTDGGRIKAMKSRKGAKFFGCENYPTCKWAAWKLPAKTDKE